MPSSSRTRFRKSFEEEENNRNSFGYHPGWPYLSLGYGSERDYFIENLSLMVASGIGINASLIAIQKGIKNRRLRRAVARVTQMIEEGSPFWKAIAEVRLFPPRLIALMRSGEETGRLPEHLNLV